jgi:hypothetical protein
MSIVSDESDCGIYRNRVSGPAHARYENLIGSVSLHWPEYTQKGGTENRAVGSSIEQE